MGFLVCSSIGSSATPAQTFTQLGPNTKENFRLWTPVYLIVNLPNRFLAYMEVHPRIGDDVTDIDQLLLRPAIGYKLTDNISIWEGYVWVSNLYHPHKPPQSPFFDDENRIYQQVNYTEKLGSLKLLSRTRLEERWIEHADGTAVRFRQMFRFTYPLPLAPDIDSPAFTGGVLSEFKLRLSRVFLPLPGYVPPDDLLRNPDRGHKVPH